MDNFNTFKSFLYTINAQNVTDIALRLFRFQAEYNSIYKKYLHYMGVEPAAVKSLTEIPYLPISFFKSQVLKTTDWQPQTMFTSSGTTGDATSTHFIHDLNFYLDHSQKCFEYFFGSLEQYHIFALMPSYLERTDSSLIAMLGHFIRKTNSPLSGFYLYDHDKLISDIAEARKSSKKIILWGVSFALLDLAEKFPIDLRDCIILETGGMKGRRKEMTRQELHSQLTHAFKVDAIYSEYGMTELLSQAYTKGGDLFYPSPWMKIVVRETVDPLEKGLISRSGGVNVIDFANIHSIAFIETEDAGKVHPEGTFEVAGRLDNSDVRGCNLMVE